MAWRPRCRVPKAGGLLASAAAPPIDLKRTPQMVELLAAWSLLGQNAGHRRRGILMLHRQGRLGRNDWRGLILCEGLALDSDLQVVQEGFGQLEQRQRRTVRWRT
jgi:hypothetical protein